MRPGADIRTAMVSVAASGPPGRILICGSLYLAGQVLKLDAPPAAGT